MFTHPLVLQNERVCLRPLEATDFDALARIAFEPAIWRFTPSRIYHEEELQHYLHTALQARSSGQRYPFAILDKHTNQLAGSTSFANYSQKDARIEIGYTWLGLSFQRTGLNKACKFLLLKHAFEKMKVQRTELKTDLLNQQSRRAMLGIGATEEGVLRSHTAMHDGRRRDTIYYSILLHEWPGIKKRVFGC